MAKDFLGNELNVGDEVVYFSQQWRVFKRGEIISFSPKMLLINIDNNHKKTLRQFHEQVIKIEKK